MMTRPLSRAHGRIHVRTFRRLVVNKPAVPWAVTGAGDPMAWHRAAPFCCPQCETPPCSRGRRFRLGHVVPEIPGNVKTIQGRYYMGKLIYATGVSWLRKGTRHRVHVAIYRDGVRFVCDSAVIEVRF